MSSPLPQTISEDLIREIVARVKAGEPTRRRLPFSGRVYIERQLPFLYIYRHPASGNDAGTDKLITGEASYLLGSHHKKAHRSQIKLVRSVIECLFDVFGGFLLVEVRTAAVDPGPFPDEDPPLPAVQIISFVDEGSDPLVDVLRKALATDKRMKGYWQVQSCSATALKNKTRPPLLTTSDAKALGCTRLVLEVPPLYRDPNSQAVFPAILRDMRRVIGVALRKTVFEFAKTRTTQKPKNFQTMGRRALVKVVWEVDSRMADIARQFDFLLALTPVNIEQAWRVFRGNKFNRPPDFRYRPLTIDVSPAKRLLFSVPTERIEDPTVADLFLEKQLELDRQLTILADRGSKRVLFGSLQLYGGVDKELLKEAYTLLELISPGAREPGDTKRVTAEQFAARASREVDWYRAAGLPVSGTHVEIRGDISSGLMVSQGQLLIPAGSTYPASRVEALIQHEVGTHVLTFLNGRSQRLQQLSVGLANYDETQEGLAVLAEYLVGGLSKPRMRLLAGRVAAAHVLIDGATFVEAFRLLLRYGFSQRIAFSIIARTYRGGGLTKDAVYLRGLIDMLAYLAAGEPLEPLYIGKLARRHVGIILELQARGVLPAIPILPRYLQGDMAATRLSKIRSGLKPHDLVEN